MPLLQLIYSSAASRELTELELSRLLLGARKTNIAFEVTGMLLYHEGSFLQVLEGKAEAVESLFARISTDPRHHRVVVLMRREVVERQFEDWSMGFVDAKRVAEALPGFSDYLRHRQGPAAGNLAMKVLAGFREGQFRSYVETA
jgi:uncharacterized Fe-S cluster-containing MiaB family protein